MLALLTPSQISDFWPLIRNAVGEARPPQVGDSADRDNNILSALLCGRMHCWGDFSFDRDEVRLNVLLLTTFSEDSCSGTSALLIYSIRGYRRIGLSEWRAGMEKLKKWAVAHGCQKMVAYTQEPSIIRLTERLGGSATYRLLSFDCREKFPIEGGE